MQTQGSNSLFLVVCIFSVPYFICFRSLNEYVSIIKKNIISGVGNPRSFHIVMEVMQSTTLKLVTMLDH